MTALAINLLALLIVLGLCWAAMMWLSGRFHGQRRTGEFQAQYRNELPTMAPYQLGNDDQANPMHTGLNNSAVPPAAPCAVCEGVGAHTSQGRLAPCPECYGTGVLSQ